MKAHTNHHDFISKLLAKVPAFFFDNSATFDSADGMFHHNPDFRDVAVEPFLHFRQCSVLWFFKGLHDKDVLRDVPLVTTVLDQVDSIRKYKPVLVGNLFVVHSAFMGWAQVHNMLVFSANDVVFYRVRFFLPL